MVALTSADVWARATATGLRLASHPDGITRLVVDLSEGIDFSTALYADPYRLVINTPPMGWSADAAVKRPVGAVRTLHYSEDSLGGRVMVDLKAPAVVKSSFVIPPRDGQGWRLVLDLQAASRDAFLAVAVPLPARKVAKAAVPPARPIAAPAARPIAAPAARPIAAPAARPIAAPAAAPAEAPRTIVITSPQVEAPAPAPAPVSPPVVAAAPVEPPKVVPVAKAAPVKDVEPPQAVSSRSSISLPVARSGGPVLSAPVPPPLASSPSQENVAQAVPAMAAPQPEPAPIVTKVSAPLPAPQPMEPMAPREIPADGKPVVVIDPGHGGVDPGAIGVSGIYEKYITLAVARELKAQLEKNGRYKVHLTRDRDIFIRLRDRIAIARQYNADLFISLHADTVSNAQMRGLSVYTLSQNASDSEAQALADKENKADLIAGIDLSHESADVANILIDLAQRETMNRSAGFAGGVVEEVGHDVTLLGNTHRFAGFAVLKAPDVPSVLIEAGYLSNEVEERALRQPEYRVKLAKGIARAVDRFFLQGQKARRP
ncbi:N-acetylmuramoyl-L-alanine amidase [Magnetospirillum aberrantis]|uniref:N-acetylmuramoyl-L-alanine amidase n=1 Tax=Magnetospirillum aberrantis SpK TaxID=908842 RepID=A0A7C9UV00_9PROT|nr:N-acetylmuramoyl-L-alanine amidase [Magnetospirillum aberrantis]NFV79330.1 N-acetylmuramoyl-L-alanine amidase [Magnetospirillum aberrantis SpK]